MMTPLPKSGLPTKPPGVPFDSSRVKRVALFAQAGLVLALSPNLARGADDNWPQWRGPLATGVAPTANPPITWSETSNVKWKVKIPGRGTATPIIWQNQIFVQTAVPSGKKEAAPGAQRNVSDPAVAVAGRPADPPAGGQTPGRRRGGGGMRSETPSEKYQFVLLSLDRQTGKTLWQKTAREEVPHEGHHRDHGFSSHSPITDGKLVFAYFGSRGLHCYDLGGNLKWSKDLGRMRTRNSFGEGSSPALHGNTVVVNWDHEGDDFIAAFDKESGKELWRQSRDEATSWSTPLILDHEGKTQVIASAAKKIRSYDLKTGQVIWECSGMTENVVPTPVAANGVVYPISGFRGASLLAIRLGRTGDLTGTDAIAWRHNKSTPYVPSPMLSGDKLYFFSGNNGILSCFDVKSGQPLIDAVRIEALPGVYASPVGAAGRVYLIGRNGAAAVIKDSDKLEVLATNRLDDKIDASPALAGRELFLRGHEHLYCIAEK